MIQGRGRAAMDMNWHVAMFITGCLITSSFVCKAQEEATFNNEISSPLTTSLMVKRSTQKVVPSEALLQVFENLDKVSRVEPLREQPVLWDEYKEKLKSLLAVQFSDSFQIGFDRVKAGPLKLEDSEIVDVNLHLSPKASSDDLKSKGYGLELRVKLD